ncbi:MAG: thioredoxin peroxidase [Sneathiella sp.]|nr:MAG: thioredoxin peroxidase [Sneathiella sp.]
MQNEKLKAGSRFPTMTIPAVVGGNVTLGGLDAAKERWQLVVVYRGKHCPICKRYLAKLEELKDDFAAADIDVIAVSGDSAEKAALQAEEGALTFPVGYDLKVEQMAELGLYISDPRSPQETDQPFPEPGLFALRPDGTLQIVDISNAPFARPELASILNGLKFIREKGYPIRGTHGTA